MAQQPQNLFCKQMRGTACFIYEGFTYFICSDYLQPPSQANVISVAAIEGMQYFFHVLMVKSEVLSRKICIFILINQVIFDSVSCFLYIFVFHIIDYFDIL